MEHLLPDITLSAVDHDRLTRLLATLPPDHDVGRLLRRELDRAEVVEPEDLPADVVTMNSRVVVEEVDSGERFEVTLTWPNAADFAAGRLSILAPVGAALLGLRAGQRIDWPLPNGRHKSVRVAAVPWQPEAVGDPR